MRRKSKAEDLSSEQAVEDIRRATRRQFSAEEKIRIALDGLRGEHSIAELCQRDGIADSLYYIWSKEFLEAGRSLLADDTVRSSTRARQSATSVAARCLGADVLQVAA